MKHDKINPPKFVIMRQKGKLLGTELRYRQNENDYYRDAGAWGVGWKFENNIFVSINKHYGKELDYLNGHELIEITKAQYRKANFGYL